MSPYPLNATDWFDIEGPIHNVINITLPAKARAHYQAMEKELFLELVDSAIEALNAAAKTIKTLQIAAGAIYSDDNHNWTEIHDAKKSTHWKVLSMKPGECRQYWLLITGSMTWSVY